MKLYRYNIEFKTFVLATIMHFFYEIQYYHHFIHIPLIIILRPRTR